MDQDQGMKKFLELIATKKCYGTTMFWVENYYKNKQNYLKNNMWLAVRYNKLILFDENSKEVIKSYDLSSWEGDHFPNALILYQQDSSPIRLTTSSVYPAHTLISYYKNKIGFTDDREDLFVVYENEEEESKS